MCSALGCRPPVPKAILLHHGSTNLTLSLAFQIFEPTIHHFPFRIQRHAQLKTSHRTLILDYLTRGQLANL